MATLTEAFDGLWQNITPDVREYRVKYNVKGFALTSEFPSYFTWQGHSDPYARLTGLTSGKQLGYQHHEVIANYSTLPADNAQKSANKDQPANPLLRSVRRSWGSGYVEIYKNADLDGKTYSSSAEEAFAGGLAIRVPYLIRKYVRNEAYFPEETAMSCLWHTNASKLSLCTRFDGSDQMEDNDVTFIEVSYEFWCLKSSAPIKWEEKQLDKGSYSLDPSDATKRVYPEDKNGSKSVVSDSLLLDGNGKALGESAEPYWITFRNYELTTFESLGLPGMV